MRDSLKLIDGFLMVKDKEIEDLLDIWDCYASYSRLMTICSMIMLNEVSDAVPLWSCDQNWDDWQLIHTYDWRDAATIPTHLSLTISFAHLVNQHRHRCHGPGWLSLFPALPCLGGFYLLPALPGPGSLSSYPPQSLLKVHPTFAIFLQLLTDTPSLSNV